MWFCFVLPGLFCGLARSLQMQQRQTHNTSKAIGNNPLSEFKDVQYGIGPSSHYEVIPVNRAGGARRVTGDYLWRTQESCMFDGGIFRAFSA